MPEFLREHLSIFIHAVGEAFPIFALIWLITLLSMAIRVIAFKRMDSWALEASAASLFFSILYGVYLSDSVMTFVKNELPRCVILLFCTLSISVIHFHFLYVIKAKRREIYQEAAQQLKDEAGNKHIFFKETEDRVDFDDDETEHGADDALYAGLSDDDLMNFEDMKLEYQSKLMMLKEAMRLSEKSLEVCYSIKNDERSYNHRGILWKRKKKEGGASKGFRPEKTAVRNALASVINNLHITGMRTLHEDDFNISVKDQRLGLLLFNVFQWAAMLTASFRWF